MRLSPVRTAATAVLAAALLTAASVAQADHNPYHPYQPSPVVKTGRATDIEVHTAVLHGSVNPNGAATSYWFEYGTTKSYGSQTTVKFLRARNHTTQVSATVRGLAPDTVYHFRLDASNSGGSATGADHKFKTGNPYQASPVVKTRRATDVKVRTAILHGSVNPNGAATTYWFEYGTTKSYGSQTTVKFLRARNHTIEVSATVRGLAPHTVYHFRLDASNSGGSATGADRKFQTERKKHPSPRGRFPRS
jgi:phosphodiesterase/alkaline phosphatase D-like protein